MDFRLVAFYQSLVEAEEQAPGLDESPIEKCPGEIGKELPGGIVGMPFHEGRNILNAGTALQKLLLVLLVLLNQTFHPAAILTAASNFLNVSQASVVRRSAGSGRPWWSVVMRGSSLATASARNRSRASPRDSGAGCWA